jgi:uncharacterized protein (TIGR03067 family)
MRVLGLAVMAAILANGPAQADDKKEIEGVWMPVEAALGEQKLPEETLKTMRLKITGNQYEVVVGTMADRGNLKFDNKAKPRTMDIIGTDGPNKGKTILGIFELTGDTMRICYNLKGEKRPTEFNTQGEAAFLLVKYKRVK